jgi:hypothetical protein
MRRSFVLFPLALAACSKAGLVDFALSGAHRPSHAAELATKMPGYRILAGDLHCHVSPPDVSTHVTRDFPQTVQLARREGLDFVVLTPHIWSGFFQSAGLRDTAVAWQRELETAIARSRARDIVFIPGFEYSSFQYGHVGLSFADVEAVFRDLPLDVAVSHPERFAEQWVGHGGLIVIHHPLQTPIDSVFSSSANVDLSFRPLTSTAPVPEEFLAYRNLAQGFEAFNLMTSRLRDWLLLHDSEYSLRRVLSLLDREIVQQGRLIAPTGGSDSHGMQLRATMFVLARDKTAAAIREAIAEGRTCVRDVAACTLVARARAGDPEVVVGGSLRGVTAIEAKVLGDDGDLIVAGRVVASPRAGQFVGLAVPPTCTTLRARAGMGFSAPISINCPFDPQQTRRKKADP